MEVRFTIKATAGGFVEFLEDSTKDVHMTQFAPKTTIGASSLKFLEGYAEHVRMASPLLVDAPAAWLQPFVGGPPATTQVDFVDAETGDTWADLVNPWEHLCGYMPLMWPNPAVLMEDGRERTTYGEAVAIGFKWTRIDELLRVTVECYEPVAKDFFTRLLNEIRQIWPESQQVLEEYLEELTPETAGETHTTSSDGRQAEPGNGVDKPQRRSRRLRDRFRHISPSLEGATAPFTSVNLMELWTKLQAGSNPADWQRAINEKRSTLSNESFRQLLESVRILAQRQQETYGVLMSINYNLDAIRDQTSATQLAPSQGVIPEQDEIREYHLSLEPLARARWGSSFDAFEAALTAFSEKFTSPLGMHSFHFHILRNPAFNKPASQHWMVGLEDYDRQTFRIGTSEEPDPSFEGWPYATITAREAPSGLIVELAYTSRVYGELLQEYLGELVKSLVKDGLVLEGEETGLGQKKVADGSKRGATVEATGRTEPPTEDEKRPEPNRESIAMPDGLTDTQRRIWELYIAKTKTEGIAKDPKVALEPGSVSNILTGLFKKGLTPRQPNHPKRKKS